MEPRFVALPTSTTYLLIGDDIFDDVFVYNINDASLILLFVPVSSYKFQSGYNLSSGPSGQRQSIYTIPI
jgi:hypothetical protein